MRIFFSLIILLGISQTFAADTSAKPEKPPLKIIPGKVIIPFDKMQRPWGELISVDMNTRTGTFRKESTDEVASFTVMPYAELKHHAAHGDLQDFKVGERVIFRLHENDKGEWVWLTYIQDEMNMMLGHKEYFYVDGVDTEKKTVTCTQANADKSFVREKGIVLETDKETRYWKAGQPAAFGDIKVGDKLRTKTHGVGKGKVRVCWEVFLDDESLLKFQKEQEVAHEARIGQEGMPGYVDEVADKEIKLTLFNESGLGMKQLKAGKQVVVAAAGVDRKASGTKLNGTVVSAKMAGRQCELVVTLEAGDAGFKPTGLARVWNVEK